MILELTKDEAWDLYFEIGKAIERHKSSIEKYKSMLCHQAIQVEEKKIQSLEAIRKKIDLKEQ